MPGATFAVWCYHVNISDLSHSSTWRMRCVCVISNPLSGFGFEGQNQWEHIWLKPKVCVCSQAHGGSSCRTLPFTARPLISHPALSHKALFKYFNPDCPSLQPIYFIWWGVLHTAWPCEKHTKWVWNPRISTAASPASSTPKISPALNHILDDSDSKVTKNISLQRSRHFHFFSCQLSGLHYHLLCVLFTSTVENTKVTQLEFS